MNFTTDLTADAIRRAVRQATSAWSASSPLVFTEVPANEGPVIRIGFFSGDHGDGQPFDGLGGVAAHAFYPPDPSAGAIDGDVHFDDAETWIETLPNSNPDLISAAIHELGHAIGLEHSTNEDSVMHPVLRPRRALHADDVKAVQALYPSRWESQRGFVLFPKTVSRGPQQVVVDKTFSGPVKRAVAMLSGYDARFSGSEEHRFGMLEVGIKVVATKGRNVTMSARLGLRDWSGNWDDPYEGKLSYVIMVEL